tara:strand:- start:32 stop:625 length:594 start_codon:yes stop_codon:yes gene_type:complete
MAIDIEDTPVDSRITLNRSIPGQGLTNDPESPYPWEKAPEFTALDTSLQYIFGLLIDPENYVPIMDVIADGTALMDITQGILFKGFTEGKWNPDLMMLLAEPVAYILLALAERADINPKIYKGEEEDEDNEATLFDMEIGKEKLKKLKEFSTTKEIPAGAIPKDIEEQIEELPIPSLLSKPEEEEEDTSTDSLLGRE